MKHRSILPFTLIMIWLLLGSCQEEQIKLPKPHMYPRVHYPVKNYVLFDTLQCDFVFRFPDYGHIVKDSFIFEGEPEHPCWFDIQSEQLNTSIHCSYYRVSPKKSLSSLINDAFTIAGKHNVKANYRKETVIDNQYGVKGMIFDIEGPVASPTQFYLTDGKNHFFRGSLYFNSKVNPDSTA
ncbi:MAG: hypothetical protein WAU01_14370, partial [Saprospiraceae bacterium]